MLAAPCHYIDLIIDDADTVQPLLSSALKNNVEPEYCRMLLRALANKRSYHCSEDLMLGTNTYPATSIGKSSSLTQTTHTTLNPAVVSTGPENLSNRELDVLELLSTGARNKDIADTLNLSLATVKRHLQNIYGKLQVSNRTEAILKRSLH
jgi:DNA-binding NarL/FixJ family response regulator